MSTHPKVNCLTLVTTLLSSLLVGAASAQNLAPSTDTFGGGAFSIDFVGIPSGSGFGGGSDAAVAYNYRMAVNEVSRGMINSYNSLSGGPQITMGDMSGFGDGLSKGANRPATFVESYEAARFVNWLNTSKGHQAAYNFTSSTTFEPIRNPGAVYFLPTIHEWRRSAYYDPNANGGTGGF